MYVIEPWLERNLIMNIIDKIYQLMEVRGWTAYMLAEQSGVDPSTIGHMFAKRHAPKIATLEKICKAFGITLSEFFADGETSEDNLELVSLIGMLSPKRKELTKEIVKEFQKK